MALIKLTNSDLFAVVDDCDTILLSKMNWSACKGRKTFYAYASINGKRVLMHRLILRVTGSKNHVDHKNGNGLDNRRENLRVCTITENNINRGAYKNNRVGLKGVNPFKNGKFGARITIGGKLSYLGIFNTAEDAGKAYDKAAKIYHGEFANLNFPR